MRLIASTCFAVCIVAVTGVLGQEPDDLAVLIAPSADVALTLSVEDGRLDEVLNAMGTIGRFEVDLAPEIGTWQPVSFEVRGTLDSVLRLVLATPGLTYRVVDNRTLLVSRS